MPVQNYENLAGSDVTTTRTMLHEAIPLTGTIISGTYGTFHSERNIKNYAHGMFQSVYDYPYLSSSANHIFDISLGYDNRSSLSGSGDAEDRVQQAKKINIYNQYAQVLLGYTGSTNEVEIFESDLNLGDNNNYMKEVFFLNFSRLLQKDQIKKGSFSISLVTGSWDTAGHSYDSTGSLTITDASASVAGGGTKNTNGGDYGVLFTSSAGFAYRPTAAVGVIFYQAGIVVLSASVLANDTSNAVVIDGTSYTPSTALQSASISGTCDAIRHRIQNISFTNTTEINSTIYFCRVPHNKYNYSSNPTYISGSKIRVKAVASDMPISYITTIGLYNASNELLAVAKLSEPLRKDPTNEITLRVRLDY